MLPLERKIIDTVAQPEYRPVPARALVRQLNISRKHQSEFLALVDGLVSAGKIRRSVDGLLRPRAAAPNIVQGTIKKTAAGAGFLIPHVAAPGPRLPAGADPRANDVFIAPSDLGDAQTGDEVLVQLHHPHEG